ncbi:MAG: glycosyltransferase [Tumebacillaceae bacterium]
MPKRSRRILILSSDFGEGHQQVAEAIRQVMAAHYGDVECQVVNIVEHLHPRLHLISRAMFLRAVQKMPTFYGYLYRKTYHAKASSKIMNELTSIGLKRLERLLQELQPDIVVSTFPFSSGAVSLLRKQGVTNVPLVTIITDHTIHQAWIHPETDLYLVGSEGVKEGLVKSGVSKERIEVTGIPLRIAFDTQLSKNDLRRRYGLSTDTPTLIISGGGYGMFGEDLLNRNLFDSLPFPIQLIILCGHNEKLRADFERELQGSRHRVMVKGYVDNMQEWMAMSDLIITKPGGVTTAEAMTLEIPMLLYKPIPGQEEDNLRYLTRAGVAQAATSREMLMEKLRVLLQEDTCLLLEMQRCARQEGRKHASHDAAQLILQCVNQPLEHQAVPVT